jgi:pSer/pThr/pTyr-binding forkhead associated (FHA) protein
VPTSHDDETLRVEVSKPVIEPVEEPLEPVAVLQIINEDGSHGDKVELNIGLHLIGKDHGPELFSRDPFLCPVHVQFSFTGQKLEVTDLDSVNGVYYRILDSVELSNGDEFRVGRQLLRLELFPEKEEQNAEHTKILGSPRGNTWGRLVKLTASGEISGAYILSGLEQVMGREKGGVIFPDDGFVSSRHARVKTVGSRCYLEDLGSSNGTFIRIRGKRQLNDGDLILLGSQPLRVDL